MNAKDIMHPEDAKAISVLQKIPLVDELCRSTMEIAYEKIFRGENLGMMVKVSESYKPEIHSMSCKVCKTIGIDTPELFIYNDPVMNAFTYGETKPFVCISSSLVEKLSLEELKAILAHECGHILCHHVLYGSVVITLQELGEKCFPIRMLSGPIEMALKFWSRRSEYSADRCAALIVGERTFQSAMLKLAVGLSDAGDDPYKLVAQAKEYHQLEKSDTWSKIQQNCRVAFFSHPQTVNRAYEIDKWKHSYTYKKLSQSLKA